MTAPRRPAKRTAPAAKPAPAKDEGPQSIWEATINDEETPTRVVAGSLRAAVNKLLDNLDSVEDITSLNITKDDGPFIP